MVATFAEVRTVSALAKAEDLIAALNAWSVGGEPLVIRDLHKHPAWDQELLSISSYEERFQTVMVREQTARKARSDASMSLKEYLDTVRRPSKHPGKTPVLYAKDAECPPEWRKIISDGTLIPAGLAPKSTSDYLRFMSKAPVETLMCYIGGGRSFTPLHKDSCASFGHNIMVYSENDGKAVWYMTCTNDSDRASAHYRQSLGIDVELHDSSQLSDEQLANAPFTVYKCEQHIGDLVLVPRRSVHHVINHGGLTVKIAWNRMTLASLDAALHDDLPIYQRVCHPESFRVKATVYYSMVEMLQDRTPSLKSLGALYHIVDLFDHILVQEFDPQHDQYDTLNAEDEEFPTMRTFSTCDFCGADTFQSFFRCCGNCRNVPTAADDDSVILCPSCFSIGRTCACATMVPVQQWSFPKLVAVRNKAAGKLQQAGQSKPRLGWRLSSNDYGRLHCVPNTFIAACNLFRRCKLDSIRKLDARERFKLVLDCTKCHQRYTERGLLAAGIHSVEALIISGAGDDAWHTVHCLRAEQRGKSSRIDDHSQSSSDWGLKLAALTLETPRCNPESAKWVLKGWYDITAPSNSRKV